MNIHLPLVLEEVDSGPDSPMPPPNLSSPARSDAYELMSKKALVAEIQALKSSLNKMRSSSSTPPSSSPGSPRGSILSPAMYTVHSHRGVKRVRLGRTASVATKEALQALTSTSSSNAGYLDAMQHMLLRVKQNQVVQSMDSNQV